MPLFDLGCRIWERFVPQASMGANALILVSFSIAAGVAAQGELDGELA
jgi:hypothetical protein